MEGLDDSIVKVPNNTSSHAFSKNQVQALCDHFDKLNTSGQGVFDKEVFNEEVKAKERGSTSPRSGQRRQTTARKLS